MRTSGLQEKIRGFPDMEERRNSPREFETLRVITEALARYDFSKDMYAKILAELLNVMTLDIGTLRIVDEENKVLRLVAAAGVSEEQLVLEVPLDDSENLAASVCRTGKPIFLTDAQSEDLPKSRLDIIKSLDIRTLTFWPIKGANGTTIGVVNLASSEVTPPPEQSRDLLTSVAQAFGAIIERQGMIRALKKSEEKCRTIVENSIQGIAIAAADPLRFVYVNPKLCSMLGYTQDEFLSMKPEEIEEIIHPEEREWYFSRYGRHLRGEIGPSRSTVRVITKDGEIQWWELAATGIDYEAGRAVLGTFIDTTERRRSLEALQDSEQRYRLLAENAKDVIWVLDLDMKMEYISPSVESLTGYSPEEILNSPLSTFLTSESVSRIAHEIQRSLTLEQEVGKHGYDAPPLELQMVHRDGSRLWIEVTRTFIRDEEGEPTAILGAARDITKRKEAQAELRQAKATAEFYNDILAHDLANIQQGIMASLELLKLNDASTELGQLIDTALLLTSRGILLTTNVKRLAQIRDGSIGLHPVDPHEMLRRATETVSESFPNKHLRVTTGFDAGEYVVHADRFLEDVFYNLLHNATRYDRSKEVEVEVNAEARGTDSLR
ncbi:PAS domain S-box protein, partial [Candidatus Thorarchaeota archaeon]